MRRTSKTPVQVTKQFTLHAVLWLIVVPLTIAEFMNQNGIGDAGGEAH